MASPILNPKHAGFFVAAIAIVAILGYGVLAGWQLIALWTAADGDVPTNSAIEYISAALTGLVGGVVATAFGVQRPDPNVNALNNLAAFATATGDRSTTKQWVGTLYVGIYLLIGVLAVATWIFTSGDASGAVKATASTFIGMVIAIIASYFASDS